MAIWRISRKFPLTLLLVGLVCSAPGYVREVSATDITITGQFNFTDNRSANPAGAVPGYFIAVGATSIVPSGVGTTAQATQGATTVPVPFIPSTIFPDNYFAAVFDLTLTGVWTLTATDAAGPVSVQTNSIPTPEKIPLVNSPQVSGALLTPHVTWTLPDFTGLGVTRILIRVRDLDHLVNGVNADIIFSSASLAANATSFDVPAGVLAPGKHYSFDILVDNIVEGFLRNRSETFTGIYATPEASALFLLGAGVVALRMRRRQSRS